MTRFSKMSAAVATALLLGCACARGGADLPPVDPGAFQRYSQDNVLQSEILGREVLYTIYFPKDYQTEREKRYSVVYMLHGYGDNNNSWNGNYLHANAQIDKLTAQGMSEMIYVFPQGFNSYYCNRYDGSFDYMDMFVEELMPLIDRSLRTIPDREHRAITGYSMGGFGAMALAEKHPELFSACAPLSMSVRTDTQYMEESQNGWNDQWGKIFGGVNQGGRGRITEYYRQHCPLHYCNGNTRESLNTVRWYFICGDNEANLLFANDSLHCVLRNHGIAHEYRVVDGGHSSTVWNPALEEVLPLFDYYMNGNAALWSPDGKKVSWSAAETADDGTLASSAYKENGTGTAVYVAHSGLSDKAVKVALAEIIRPTAKAGHILLPCDLSVKSLDQWMSDWDAVYPHDKKMALAIGEAGQAVMQAPSGSFDKTFFINAETGETPQVTSGQKIYFAATENFPYYRDIFALYCASKRNGAEFEYRVSNSSAFDWEASPRDEDGFISEIVIAIKSITNYITF